MARYASGTTKEKLNNLAHYIEKNGPVLMDNTGKFFKAAGNGAVEVGKALLEIDKAVLTMEAGAVI